MGWPGYRVFQKEIDEPQKKLKLWVRRKKAGLKLICGGCGQVPAPSDPGAHRRGRHGRSVQSATRALVASSRSESPMRSTTKASCICDSDQVAFALSFCDDLLRGIGRHSSDRRKELPLVRISVEVGVNEYAVARVTGTRYSADSFSVSFSRYAFRQHSLISAPVHPSSSGSSPVTPYLAT